MKLNPNPNIRFHLFNLQNTLFPTLITNISSCIYSKSGISCASTTLLARGPTYKPIPLIVLLHGLPRPSSELLARIQTRIPVFPTMNSLAHSILNSSMRWTPLLTRLKRSNSSELNRSRSACDPPITNFQLATQAKHIPDPMDLILQAQTPQNMHIIPII